MRSVIDVHAPTDARSKSYGLGPCFVADAFIFGFVFFCTCFIDWVVCKTKILTRANTVGFCFVSIQRVETPTSRQDAETVDIFVCGMRLRYAVWLGQSTESAFLVSLFGSNANANANANTHAHAHACVE